MISVDLTGQVALVTGSTRGLGLAIVQTLHQAGAAVAVVGRGAAQAAEVANTFGERAVGVGMDVTDRAQVEAGVQQAESALGPVSILVNNAGITRDNLLLRMGEDDWDAVLQANLTAAFLTTRLVLKGMMKRRAGRIINVSSVVGLIGNKGQANYAASKAGLIGFTKSVAREYATRGILANCIAPGYIETDMTAALPTEASRALFEQIPLGRFGQPDDVARAALFLASEWAQYITGQVLVVDGGMVT